MSTCLCIAPPAKPLLPSPLLELYPLPLCPAPVGWCGVSLGACASSSRRDFLRAKLLEKEADLMKDVPDWEVGASVYKTRHMKPMEQIGVLPSSIFGIPK